MSTKREPQEESLNVVAQKVPDVFLDQYTRSEKILHGIRELRSKPHPSLKDLRRLALLRADLAALSPRNRFGWIEGRPVIDILAELVRSGRPAVK